MKILLAVDASEAALHACRLVASYQGDRSALEVVCDGQPSIGQLVSDETRG